jgi:Uma2 family endonuclease
LITGQRLTVDEFLRRWEELPDLKHAELIDGVVYLPSPLSREHGRRDRRIVSWLAQYEDATPGCESAIGSTWLMLGSAPQPDSYLRILPAYGGQSVDKGLYCAGAPELAVEISGSSIEIDLGPKLELYQRAGVREYITVEIAGQRITWRVLEGGVYATQAVPPDGILRSHVFPGLWLDVAAFWADDAARLRAALEAGLASGAHHLFVERLAKAK